MENINKPTIEIIKISSKDVLATSDEYGTPIE